jgi:hypothetical protein
MEQANAKKVFSTHSVVFRESQDLIIDRGHIAGNASTYGKCKLEVGVACEYQILLFINIQCI